MSGKDNGIQLVVVIVKKSEFVIRVVGDLKSTMSQFFLSRFLIMKTYIALNSSKFILNHVNIFQLLKI